MNKLLLIIASCALCNVALAQVGTTVKEGAKATSEKTQQLGDDAKASVESQPDKSIDKAKARIHKANAHHHAQAAKDAAKDIVQLLSAGSAALCLDNALIYLVN